MDGFVIFFLYSQDSSHNLFMDLLQSGPSVSLNSNSLHTKEPLLNLAFIQSIVVSLHRCLKECNFNAN